MRNTRELIGAIADKTMLVILDNCEHVSVPLRTPFTQCFPPPPTSRYSPHRGEPLGIVGEVLFRVPSLSIPPESALFDSGASV